MIGHSHALDLILTGRGVSGDEARMMGLANVLIEPGRALEGAIELAQRLAAFPQRLHAQRSRGSYAQWDLSLDDALREETRRGLAGDRLRRDALRSAALRRRSRPTRQGRVSRGGRRRRDMPVRGVAQRAPSTGPKERSISRARARVCFVLTDAA